MHSTPSPDAPSPHGSGAGEATAAEPASARPGRRYGLVRDSASYALGLLVPLPLAAVLLFWSRTILSTRDFGVLGLIRLLSNYLGLVRLGGANGAEREIPLAVGRGDIKAAARARQVMLTVTGLESLLVAALFAIYHASTGGARTADLRLALWTLVAIVPLQAMSYGLVVCMKSAGRVSAIGPVNIVVGAVDLLTSGTAIYLWGLKGALLASVAVPIVRLWLLRRGSQGLLTWRPAIEWRSFKPLMLIGLSMHLGNIGWQLYASADSVQIASRAGLAALGVYTLGTSFGVSAAAVPQALAFAFLPALMHRLGACGADLPAIRSDFCSILVFQMLIVYPATLFPVALGIPPLVSHWLPQYVATRQLALTLLALIATKLAVPMLYLPFQILLAKRRVGLVVLLPWLFAAAAWLAVWWTLRAGGDLLNIAAASGAVYFPAFALLLLLALRDLRRPGDHLRVATLVWLSVLPAAAIGEMLLIDAFLPLVPGAGLWASVLHGTLRTLLAFALWLPVAALVSRWYPWLGALRGFSAAPRSG